MRDFFIYPEFVIQDPESTDGRAPNIIPSENIITWIKSHPRIVIRGGPLSGRTSLAKIIFSDLLASGDCVPLFMDGQHIKARTERQWAEQFWKVFESQYQSAMLSDFRLLSKDNRALLIDNWHNCKLNAEGRDTFLATAVTFFDRIVIFSDSMLQLRDGMQPSSTIYTAFDHATLNPFRHRSPCRNIIDKWLSLSTPTNLDPGRDVKE